MGLFYLTTLYSSIRAVDAAAGRARTFWMAGAILACALGMGTKEVMVTAPLMVMLWDRQFAPRRATARRSLYVGLAATWAVLAALVAGGHRATSVGFTFPDWPWWRYLMTQAEVVACYLRLAVLPTPLVLDYEWPAATSMAQVTGPGALIAVLLSVTVWGLARRSPAAFAGAWFFLILAPTSSVLPIVTEVAAEHRMYLPVAGVITLLVLGPFELGRLAAETKAFPGRHVLRHLGFVASAAVVILLARMTHERNADYHVYDRIWSDTVAKRPQNARARNNYATSLLAQGRFAEAEPQLRVAVKREPAYPEAEANLGAALSALGRLEEGSTHLVRAIGLRPDFGDAHKNLGENYALQHRLGEAAAAYSAGLVHKPDDVHLLNRIAWILATCADDRVRDGARARALADRAVELSGRQDAESLDTLGAALAEMGQFDQAANAARKALAVAARAGGDPERSSQMAFRVSLYTRGQAFREP